MANEERLLTEIPSSLKQLARLVVRGFYTIEDSLIVDMLVRNPCMKEDDICDLLKFDRKMLRARIASLKSDKFIQVRLRMETGLDGKAQKANYYFINYKTFVNVVKYKLDLMRKRLETEERDATSRASFKCSRCSKTFTDLEADQLFDFASGEFRCTYCLEPVEEDQSAVPKKDSRLLLAKFNEQLDPLYTLLREVEGIKLAPEVLEPEPVDIGAIRGGLNADKRTNVDNGFWSGESTRNSSGFGVEEARVDVNIINNDDDDDEFDDVAKSQNGAVKEQPIWMTESTVASASDRTKPAETTSLIDDGAPTVTGSGGGAASSAKQDDIMSVLLAHEKRSSSSASTALSGLLSDQQQQQQKQKIDDSDTSSDDDRDGLSSMAAHYHKDAIGGGKKSKKKNKKQDAMSMMMIMDEESNDDEEGIDDDGFGAGRRTNDDDDDDDEDVNVPTVSVGDRVYPINEIDDSAIAQMTQSEKEIYVQVFQDYYSHIAY